MFNYDTILGLTWQRFTFVDLTLNICRALNKHSSCALHCTPYKTPHHILYDILYHILYSRLYMHISNIYIYIYPYSCPYPCIYNHIYIYIYIYICIDKYIHIYIYIYIHVELRPCGAWPRIILFTGVLICSRGPNYLYTVLMCFEVLLLLLHRRTYLER